MYISFTYIYCSYATQFMNFTIGPISASFNFRNLRAKGVSLKLLFFLFFQTGLHNNLLVKEICCSNPEAGKSIVTVTTCNLIRRGY